MVSYIEIDKIAQVLKMLFVMINLKTKFDGIFYWPGTKAEIFYKVHTTKTLPSLGSSDHDIVFHEISMPIGRPLQPKRNIKLFGKANWEQFIADINLFNETFQQKDESDTNSLWNSFKSEIDRLSKLHIPSKMTRSRTDLPWITGSIRRKIHRRDKLYQKVKSSNGKQNYEKLKSKLTKFKSVIQNEIRKSYWEYLESVIFTNDADKCKKQKKIIHS